MMTKSVLVRWYAYHNEWEARAKASDINRKELGLEAEVVERDDELLPWIVEVYAPMRER